MTKKKRGDAFAKDKIEGEYSPQGPKVDPGANAIAQGLSKLTKRVSTGFVINWLPPWAKKAKVNPFSFFYFEDRLAVDFFGRDREEMDAMADDLSQSEREEIATKTSLAGEHGVRYLVIGPDDELDMTQLAAKIGRTTVKRDPDAKPPVRQRRNATDGISEEDI